MAEATEQKQLYFKCPECKKDLLWNARVAGHRVSCPCGHVFVAPMRKALVEPEGQKVVKERTVPRRNDELAALWMRPRKRVLDDEEEKAGVVRNVIVPSVLIVVGLAIAMANVTWTKKQIGDRKLDLSLMQMMLILLAMVVTTAAAITIINMLMALDFGGLKPAGFKIVSIPIFAGALGIAAGRLDKDPPYVAGMVVGWSILILCYWFFFYYYFKLELHEMLIVCFVVSVVQAVAMFGMFV